MTGADLAAWVEKSRADSGLEPKVRDPAVLARLARMVAGRREAVTPLVKRSA